MAEHYDTAGYGGQTIGFGERPAVLVVDYQLGFTDPRYPAGQSPHIHAAVERTAELLGHARARGVPVANCNVAWCSAADMGHWKVSSLYDGSFFKGHPSTELDPRIHEPGYDVTFTKSAPSIFFQTPLMLFLTRQQVDTVIVTGCTTSGCVRASINDGFSYGFRVIVPEQCCGDQDVGPHKDNLRDVGRRYADVLDTDEVIAYLDGLEPVGTSVPLAAARG
ncbi:MAG: isochorismatase family protein [Gammaproteobacteria bacterium]